MRCCVERDGPRPPGGRPRPKRYVGIFVRHGVKESLSFAEVFGKLIYSNIISPNFSSPSLLRPPPRTPVRDNPSEKEQAEKTKKRPPPPPPKKTNERVKKPPIPPPPPPAIESRQGLEGALEGEISYEGRTGDHPLFTLVRPFAD